MIAKENKSDDAVELADKSEQVVRRQQKQNKQRALKNKIHECIRE